jgi:uncharacterized short protein YbdD (DUF466 family)
MRRDLLLALRLTHISTEVADGVSFREHEGEDGRRRAKCEMRERFSAFTKCVCQGARLIVGFPDYDTYLEHMRRTHPGAAVMTYPEFFRERQNARYGAGGRKGFRCC